MTIAIGTIGLALAEATRITNDLYSLPPDTPPAVLGSSSATRSFPPDTQAATLYYVSDPRGSSYLDSGIILFTGTDAGGNTKQCPVSFNFVTGIVLPLDGAICSITYPSLTKGYTPYVYFDITFNDSAAGINFSVYGSITDIDGLTGPQANLGTWSIVNQNTSPPPSFTMSCPTITYTLTPGSTAGVPVPVTIAGPSSFTDQVRFSATNNQYLSASGTGSLGNSTAYLFATNAGPTVLNLTAQDVNDVYINSSCNININTNGPPGSQTTIAQTINSNPPGLQINIDPGTSSAGICPATPCTFQWLQGDTHTISAPSQQTANGVQWTFSGWSDGGAQSHSITVGSAAATYTASYMGPPAPAPTLALLQTTQTIAAQGAASFPVYVSQSSTTTSILGVTAFTGGTIPAIRPASLTGPGWATIVMYGPSVGSATTYNFSVTASGTAGYAQTPAAHLTVNPTGLQPDFTLSTNTATLGLAQNVQATLPVTIDTVGGYSGTIIFSSNTPGITVTGSSLLTGHARFGGYDQRVSSTTSAVTLDASSSSVSANVYVTLSATVAPAALILTGTDAAGNTHQLTANCETGPTGDGRVAATPQTATGYADVPIGGSATVPFLLDMTAAAAQTYFRSLPLPPCSGGGNSFLTLTPISGFIDPNGYPNVNVIITAGGNTPPGPIGTILCDALLLYSVMPFLPCTPNVTGVQVNGQNNNVVVAGTGGYVTLVGTCLASVDALQGGYADTPSITYYPQFNGSPGSVSFDYTVTACDQSQATCDGTGTHGLTLLAQGVRIPIGDTLFETNLKVQQVTFGGAGNIVVMEDIPGQSPPLPINFPVWSASPANQNASGSCSAPATANCLPVAYVSGSKMSGTVTFSVNPPAPATVNGFRADGMISGVGTLNATGLTIPANSSLTNQVSFLADTALASRTAYWNPMQVNWQVTPNPNFCPNSACGPAGSSSDPLYVTLAAPTLTNWGGPIPATLLYLATAPGGAATEADIFKNIWAEFSTRGTVNGYTAFLGPGNVTDWLGLPLTYYASGQGFDACAFDVTQLLTSPAGSGQCGSFTYLFLGALATNGIRVSAPDFYGFWTYSNPQAVWTTVYVNDATKMMVNNWSFNGLGTNTTPVPGSSYQWPYSTNLGFPDYMVPGPPSYGDLTNGFGVAGQNSANPSEKVFDAHFIVGVLDNTLLSSFGTFVPPVASSGPYFDPSYGLMYGGSTDFQSEAIVGYIDPVVTDSGTVYVARKSGGPNITLLPCSSDPGVRKCYH